MTMITAADLWGFQANRNACETKMGQLGYLRACGMG